MDSSGIHVSTWPVVLIVSPPHFDPAWVGQLDAAFADVFARRAPFAVLTETSAVSGIPGARERKLLADWAGRADLVEHQRRWCVGSSTILKSSLVRGTLQALYWLWTPPSPQHAAKDFDEAWRWCMERLDARGVALPGSASELRRAAERQLARVPVGIRDETRR